MAPTKRPPNPEDVAPRRTADGAADALRRQLPTNGGGLGPVGERVIQSLIDDSEQEEERQRLFMRFTPKWRAIIRWFDDDKLDTLQAIVRLLDDEKLAALQAMLDDYMEKRVLRVFWRRVWASLLVIVPAVFGAAQYGFDRIPLIRSIFAMIRGL